MFESKQTYVCVLELFFWLLDVVGRFLVCNDFSNMTSDMKKGRLQLQRRPKLQRLSQSLGARVCHGICSRQLATTRTSQQVVSYVL